MALGNVNVFALGWDRSGLEWREVIQYRERAEGRIMELKITSQQPWQEEARDVPGVDEMRATVSIYNYAEEVGWIINVHRAFVRGILDSLSMRTRLTALCRGVTEQEFGGR